MSTTRHWIVALKINHLPTGTTTVNRGVSRPDLLTSDKFVCIFDNFYIRYDGKVIKYDDPHNYAQDTNHNYQSLFGEYINNCGTEYAGNRTIK